MEKIKIVFLCVLSKKLAIEYNEEGIKEGKIKGDLNHKCMIEVRLFDNAPKFVRGSKPPLILLSFNLMLYAAASVRVIWNTNVRF